MSAQSFHLYLGEGDRGPFRLSASGGNVQLSIQWAAQGVQAARTITTTANSKVTHSIAVDRVQQVREAWQKLMTVDV